MMSVESDASSRRSSRARRVLTSTRDDPSLQHNSESQCALAFSLTPTIEMADLSALRESAQALNAHLKRDLPAVNLSLDQIEAQSRRLVSRQAGTSDNDRAYVVLSRIVQHLVFNNSLETIFLRKHMSTLLLLQTQ